MANEKSGLSLFKLLSGLLQTLISSLNDLVDLAALELQLATKSLVAILCVAVFILLLMVSAWFCFLVLLASILAIFLKLPYAILIVFIINVLFIIPLGLIIWRLKNYLTFPATRRQFKTFKENSGKVDDERVA